jgi:hypothetical protein
VNTPKEFRLNLIGSVYKVFYEVSLILKDIFSNTNRALDEAKIKLINILSSSSLSSLPVLGPLTPVTGVTKLNLTFPWHTLFQLTRL